MNKSLNAHLNNIGINIYASDKVRFSDIEVTILSAIQEANTNRDSKLLSLILSWAHEYAVFMIPEKLNKYQGKASLIGGEPLYYNLFCIYCFEVLKLHKFKKLIDMNVKGYLTEAKKDKASIKMKGEEAFSKKYGIHIPSGVLRIRDKDVIAIDVLVKKNDQLANRLLIGANWRADIITEIQRDNLNAYQISKKLGCSYEPVNRILKQYKLVS